MAIYATQFTQDLHVIGIKSCSPILNLVENFSVSLPYVSGSYSTKFATYLKFSDILQILTGLLLTGQLNSF